MSANLSGVCFQYLSFGESHGPSMGVVIEGCPAGVNFDDSILKDFLRRRRPGQNHLVSPRNELDEYEILSGIYEGKTLGTPISLRVLNTNQKSEDYDIKGPIGRIGHADDVWRNKFGVSDPRGGGRSSGRETISRVIAGAFAKMFVTQLSKSPQVEIKCGALQIGKYKGTLDFFNKKNALENKLGFMGDRFKDVESYLTQIKNEGDSVGGVAAILIRNTPIGLGQPVFRKLKSDFAQGFFSIGAVCGVELGSEFDPGETLGSAFHRDNNSQIYGGIRGGISTGEDILFRIKFKPTSSFLKNKVKGRHDPCIIPRALPVLEAISWTILADHLLWSRLDRI